MSESFKNIMRNEASVVFLLSNPRRENPRTAHMKILIDSYKIRLNKESKVKSSHISQIENKLQ